MWELAGLWFRYGGDVDLNLQKEQFSRAYVPAIAAAAAFAAEEPLVDDDSVDMEICARGGEGTTKSPRLEVQVKCTSSDVLRDNISPTSSRRRTTTTFVPQRSSQDAWSSS